MSNVNLGWFIFFWIVFTCVNIKINMLDVENVVQQRYAKKDGEAKRQDEPMYIAVLNKVKSENCLSTTDKENNTFYTCKDGTKVSMIHWTRGNERKGVVTREYSPDGKLMLIYGHPDDVY